MLPYSGEFKVMVMRDDSLGEAWGGGEGMSQARLGPIMWEQARHGGGGMYRDMYERMKEESALCRDTCGSHGGQVRHVRGYV